MQLQQEVLSSLLDVLVGRELISESTCDKAKNVVHSTIDFPDFFWYPVCCEKEGNDHGRA